MWDPDCRHHPAEDESGYFAWTMRWDGLLMWQGEPGAWTALDPVMVKTNSRCDE